MSLTKERDVGLVPTEKADEIDLDAVMLASLGYRQELRRDFSPLQIFGLGLSIVGLVSSFSSVLIFSIPYGSQVAMVWGWLVASVFLATIALALAELASAAPTSGGLYYWTFHYSSNKYRCFLSWIVGYANTISNIAGVASIEWGCAVQVMAAVSLGTSFEATNVQTFGVYCALIVVHGIINTFRPKVIAHLQAIFIALNVILCCVVIVVLPAATSKELKNPASIAFGQFTNLSGWSNGFAFVLSFLTPAWSASVYDAPIHMSEEAKNAAVVIPWTIITTIGSTLILGWAINVALAFSMGSDTQAILDSSVGQPMATILLRSFGTKGSVAIWSVIVVVQFGIGTVQLTTCSRQLFAFCRDGALPLSRWTYRVNSKTHSPIRAVWMSAFLSILLGALSFAGPNAINAVFALVITGQYTAYSIPIAARWLGGRPFKAGPVSLGSWGLPIAVVALVWMAFMSVIVMFPADPNPGVSGMNYTVVVHVGVLFLATVYYFFPRYGGMYWFEGPRSTVQKRNEEGRCSP